MDCWSLYLVRTARGALYAGISTDVERRFAEHVAGKSRAAKALRSRAPLVLAYRVVIGDRALAARAEHRLKRLPKSVKEDIVRDGLDAAALLERLGLASDRRADGRG